MRIKAILGYRRAPGVSEEDYDEWLFSTHLPDLLANPHLDKIVANKVLRPVRTASGGTMEIPAGEPLYRISELYFDSEQEYANYLRWFEIHPIPQERGPRGRTEFAFYVLAESAEITR